MYSIYLPTDARNKILYIDKLRSDCSHNVGSPGFRVMVAVEILWTRVPKKLVVARLVKPFAPFVEGEDALIAFEPFVGLYP